MTRPPLPLSFASWDVLAAQQAIQYELWEFGASASFILSGSVSLPFSSRVSNRRAALAAVETSRWFWLGGKWRKRGGECERGRGGSGSRVHSLLCKARVETSLLVSVGDGCVWLVSREQLGDLGASTALCGTAARHSGKAAPVKRTADSFPCSCYTATRDPAH